MSDLEQQILAAVQAVASALLKRPWGAYRQIAQDVVDEAPQLLFLKFLSLDLDMGRNVQGLAYRILYNEIIDRIRKEKRQAGVGDPPGGPNGGEGSWSLEQMPTGDAVNADARGAACRLAAAIGECRLFGAQPQEPLDGTLTVPMAKAAAEEALARIDDARSKAERLPDLWDASATAIEAEELCLGLVEERLTFWAVMTALEEAFIGALDDGTAVSSGLESVWLEVLDAIERLDAAMQEQRSYLAVAAETNLLRNWRNSVVAPYNVVPAWVLDGTLETAAAELEARALATQPERAAKPVIERAPKRQPGLPETMGASSEDVAERVTEAFRRHFRPERMLALAAAGDKTKETKVLWDSKQDLAPVRIIVYEERNGDLRLYFSSMNDADENQTYEVIVEEQTRPTFTFRRDPTTKELFGEARISRDELPEVGLSKLTYRLKRP